MAQDGLVNYRHMLSKRGVCCQVLQHEVGLVLSAEREGGVSCEIAWQNGLPGALSVSVFSLSNL